MISRACLIRITSSIGLVLSCAFGLYAGTNEAPVAASAAIMANDAATGQPAGDTSNPKMDLARALSPNDVISVTVYQEDDLATKATIDKSGMVMLPLLGQVQVGGLTTAEATTRIQKLYDKDYLVNPQVNLIVEDFAKRHFSVLGDVQRPGSYDFPQNQPVNLLEAIATAGGYTRLGKPSAVSLRRLEKGSPVIYHLDAEKMAKDDKEKVFEVLPDDVITVGERTF